MVSTKAYDGGIEGIDATIGTYHTVFAIDKIRHLDQICPARDDLSTGGKADEKGYYAIKEADLRDARNDEDESALEIFKKLAMGSGNKLLPTNTW